MIYAPTSKANIMRHTVENNCRFEPSDLSTRPHAKNIDIRISSSQMSSDAGLIPFFELDQHLGFTASFGEIIRKARSESATHSALCLLRQRIFGLIAGYEDQNDHTQLRNDPVMQYIAGDKETLSAELASQPTFSRFENSITARMLLDMRDELANQFVASFDTDPRRITLDIDAFADPTHGCQQLTLFCGYEQQYQYFPLAITCAENDLVASVSLRHGTARAFLGADDDLRLVITRLRERFPDVEISVRGDAGFGVPCMFEVCDKLNVIYTFGFTMNPVVKKLSKDTLAEATKQYQENVARGEVNPKARLFSSHTYQARSWDRPRHLIVKSEVHSEGENQRAIITNRPGANVLAEATYDEYVDRGESENRNKELKRELHADRLSCHRFLANVFRLMMSSLAHNLQVLMRRATSLGITPEDVGIDSELPPEALEPADRKKYQNRRRSQDPYSEGFSSTWRMRLIKVAARVVVSTRRIFVELSQSWPYLNGFFSICERLKNYIATHTQPTWRSSLGRDMG
jgi:hypothetical protein